MTASDVVTDFSITPNTGERVLMALAACGYNAPTRAPRISEEQKKALQCGVCLEVMTKPVSTPCGHNFCANCLRHAMICAPRCPLCREQLHGMVFRVNHMLQDMITTFLRLHCRDIHHSIHGYLFSQAKFAEFLCCHHGVGIGPWSACCGIPHDARAELMVQLEKFMIVIVIANVPASFPRYWRTAVKITAVDPHLFHL